MIRYLATLSLILMTLNVSAQTFNAFVKAGEEALERSDFQAALQHFAGALQQRPQATGVAYQYAEVARRFHAYEQAETYYLQVLESPESNRFPNAQYGLGRVYQAQGNYEKAIAYFQAFLNQNPQDKKLVLDTQQALSQSIWAKAQPETNERWAIENMGRRINTDYSEFGALLKNDTLYYSSFRYDMEEDQYKPPRKITHVLYQKGNGRGRPLRRSFNSGQRHTAHTAISLNQKRIYFTYCDYVSASEIRCQLYYRERDSRDRWEPKAKALPKTINREGKTATHPSIGYDSTLNAEVLFFVSEGEGAKLDLYFVAIDSVGAFGMPQPVADLNTPQDELTPFFHTPTQTLYFSSDGRDNFGGYDVFRSQRTASGWGKAENLGAPFNTSYNDVYYSLQPNGEQGFLASNRPGSFYLDEDNKACCNDLYQFRYVPPPPPDTTTLAEEPVELPTPTPEIPTKVEIPSTLQDFLPLALYFDNDEPDRRTRRTTTKKTYGESYERYYDRQGEYLEAFAEPLQGERAEEAALAVETFFEEEVRRGYDYLIRFSEILLRRLQQGDEVEIFMKGYTSPRAKSDYNFALSKRRISSVRNHFRTYQNGVFLPYLEKGQLTLTERPYGEAEASNLVSDVLEDLRNSIYHPDAARERRVEILEIESK
jgi:tetratricopeptide (TPR) repeat protein